MKPLLIVFEGLDGSGHSTQASLLKDYLEEKMPIILTKEPTESIIGGVIKSSLKNEIKISPMTLQILYSADRENHLQKEVIPAIESGKTVIMDRYILSSYAYGKINCDIDKLKSFNIFRKPDLTFIIDISPETGIKRIEKSRYTKELFEDLDILKKVRENFKEMKSEFENVFVIDGEQEKKEIHMEIRKIIDKFI